jgi:N-acetylglucosaminyl-diphospho-decaprenol L-rhamnosyltransferase
LGFGNALRHHLCVDRDPLSDFSADWLSGCFLFFRRKAFEQVGGFDEGFRKYFEDVDICERIAKAGWKVMHCGATWVVHEERRASGRFFSRDAFWHGVSYLRWLKRRWGEREVGG